MNDVVRGNNEFAVNLYRKNQPGAGNLFFSPFSISTALAMTSTGAVGETARDMASTLRLPEGSEADFARLNKQIFGGDPRKLYQLSLANALWGQSGLDYSADFLNKSESCFQATLHPLDFAHDPEKARRTINRWVEERTNDKIKDLLSPSAIKRDTDLVLTNAIYLKAAWATQFLKNATSEQDFTTASGAVRVPLMHHTGTYRYFESVEEPLQVVDLPYQGGTLSMVVILPKAADGLARVEATLSSEKLADWFSKLASTQRVDLFLPRFKLEQSFDLGTTLKELGMARAFSAQADFSGITTSRPLHISDVVHKAFVEVNEEGTEAAAATAVMMARTAVMIPQRPPVVFRADHPFLFLIRDVASGSILFLGRVVKPV